MPALRHISVHLPPSAGSSYTVAIGADIVDTAVRELKGFLGSHPSMVLTDDRVHGIWAAAFVEKLRESGLNIQCACVPEGERSKSWECAQTVLEKMMSFSLNRDSGLIAIGGGVVGDLGAFAASIYMRGISCFHVPTTLLAQVDSCLGGKTAVDLPTAKNAVGTFHQPKAVYVDTLFLSSLPDSALANGMAEVIKYGAIKDTSILTLLEQRTLERFKGLSGVWPELVACCLNVKSDVVTRDERDRGERMILNFGHTAGHALEVVTGFEMPHGEAVAFGMSAACRISEAMGFIDRSVSRRIDRLLERFGLPTVLPEHVSPEAILNCLPRDKKASSGKIRWVLLSDLGHAFVTDEVPAERIVAALRGNAG
ncbi:MAG: 3-dehydroquinate synthase [Deltaproteobacteria bacterium]|nr:3-dehydroquinate synthase [Deltaproteobacteria bacterium]